MTDEELAARYFDVFEAPDLKASGVPEDGVEHLRRYYILGACNHPEALRQLREMEATLSSE